MAPIYLFAALVAAASEPGHGAHRAAKEISPMAAATPDSFALRTNDGREVHLGDPPFRGKALLIVNTASECGYTPQYAGLEKLHSQYGPRGLVVLGFPSNDFGGQEPGDDAQIKSFCTREFKVTFPLFAKAPVVGEAGQPLFRWLAAHQPDAGPPAWNFEKYVLDGQHRVVAHFRSKVTPESAELAQAIEQALPPPT